MARVGAASANRAAMAIVRRMAFLFSFGFSRFSRFLQARFDDDIIK
jgi:hypothetical protein